MKRNSLRRLVDIPKRSRKRHYKTNPRLCASAFKDVAVPAYATKHRNSNIRLKGFFDEKLVFKSASSTGCSSSQLPTRIPPEGLHLPLKPTNPVLLRMSLFACFLYFRRRWNPYRIYRHPWRWLVFYSFTRPAMSAKLRLHGRTSDSHCRTLNSDTRLFTRWHIYPRRTHSTALEARILQRMV